MSDGDRRLRIVFDYSTVTNPVAVDALVYALSINLYTQHSIESYQTSYNTLEFTCERHLAFAILALPCDAYSITVSKDSSF